MENNVYLSLKEIRALKAAIHTLAARLPNEFAENDAYKTAYARLSYAQEMHFSDKLAGANNG